MSVLFFFYQIIKSRKHIPSSFCSSSSSILWRETRTRTRDISGALFLYLKQNVVDVKDGAIAIRTYITSTLITIRQLAITFASE